MLMGYIWDGSEDWTGKTFDGDFQVNGKVSSLKGCPKVIKGDFNCSANKNLKSLEGSPEIVEGFFDCSICYNLET
jgi:hypothetical protein